MTVFTQEEKNLINLLDSPDRSQLISDIKDCLSLVIYPDEKKLMRTVIDKLKHMTDAEYAGSDLFPIYSVYD